METIGPADSRPEPKPLDKWASEHPWHPRVAPWFAYLLVMALTLQVRDWYPWAYAPLKIVQAVVVCYLVWRFRRLVPEITLRFHCSVVPISAVLAVAWVSLQGWTAQFFPQLVDTKPTFFQTLYVDHMTLFWIAATAHLVAMSTAVPLIEETFNRSLLLRSISDVRATGTGILQMICDLPIIGAWLARTPAGVRANQEPPALGAQFQQIPLGRLSFLGVTTSTTLFMLVHATVDWPGAILCGLTWCILLNRTRHLGLGPVIWSHATVNLLLWIYAVTLQDFRMLP
ncbi:CPBP family glutamic-type intramembrane protease [Planctomycetaceae bacterium SH139]